MLCSGCVLRGSWRQNQRMPLKSTTIISRKEYVTFEWGFTVIRLYVVKVLHLEEEEKAN